MRTHTIKYLMRRGRISGVYREAFKVLLKYTKNFRVFRMEEKMGIMELKCSLVNTKYRGTRIKRAWNKDGKWYMELRHNLENETTDITVILNPPKCFIPSY